MKRILNATLFLIVLCSLISCGNTCKHSWDEGVVLEEATCESEGLTKYTCTLCNQTKTETINRVSHTPSDEYIITETYHYHLCKYCQTYQMDVNEHSYDDDHLCVCGMRDPNYIDGYQVVFEIENGKVIIYNTQDKAGGSSEYTSDQVFYAKTSDGFISKTGDEQVNFEVVVDEGYKVEIVEVLSGTYKNIKTVDSNIYRITKISSDIVIKVKVTSDITKVSYPKAYNTTFAYTGLPITFMPEEFDETIMVISNNVSSEVGEYLATIALKDKENYVWENGKVSDYLISYKIVDEIVELNLPEANDTVYIYNTMEQTYLPNHYSSDLMTIENNVQKNAGEYEVVVSVIDDSKYIFSNGQTSVTYLFTIQKQTLEIPVLSDMTFYYTGEEIEVIPTNFNDTLMKITGNKGLDVAQYILVISLIDEVNYMWSDKTSGDVSLSWEIAENNLSYKIKILDDNNIRIIHEENGQTYELILTYGEGSIYAIDQQTGELGITVTKTNLLTLSYTLKGTYFGGISFSIVPEIDIEIELSGVTITSNNLCPLKIEANGNVDISAKKNTENYIYDNRELTEDFDDAIYVTSDLKLKGTGSLRIESKNNKGIHTKDDLMIQKLTLYVDCLDNALKGNDSVVINSGTLTLIARQGDGIKTSNTALSSKGKQKGDITIEDGVINIYAACDGIDAANSVVINNGAISIYTDKYSEYSEEVTKVIDEVYYIRANTNNYKYSIYYFNTENDGEWVSSTTYETKFTGRETYYYYELPKLSSYSYLKVYVYTSSQSQGNSSSYYKVSNELTLNNYYDTIAFTTTYRPGSSNTFSWTNYTTSMGGPMDQGNTDKGDYSTKGIKADNEITINNGVINIKSYDDSIHTNNDVTIESGITPTGNIIINGGTLTLYSNDDAIHGDGTVTINGGIIKITNSYEGIEGNIVNISNGDISVISSDDGINATTTSGTGIKVSGGNIYVCAGGDGFDSNSQTSYKGITFSGGTSVIISYGRSDSSIDTERGYEYLGGYVVGIGMSGGMSNESTNCSNFITIGKSTSINLSMDNYLIISDLVTIKIPKSMSALVVVLGSSNSSITSNSQTSVSLDDNGVYWN